MDRNNKFYKYKNTFITVILCSIVLGIMLGGIFLPKKERSESERRPLAQPPKFSLQALLSGELMSDMEKYSTDHLPTRELLRRMKAVCVYSIFMQKENNGIGFLDGYHYKADEEISHENINKTAASLNSIYDKYLKNKGCKTYLSIIPDKGWFAMKQGLPALDSDALIEELTSRVDFSIIDLRPLLSLNDYYRTDIHLRQEACVEIARFLAQSLGVELRAEYSESLSPKPFFGVYYGQAALPVKGDELKILQSDFMKDCTVFDYEENKFIEIYDREKLMGRDPYEVFLSGSKSLLEIKNPNATTKNRLILFRDSFGSAIAPLLSEAYESIILVDLRYISPAVLDRFIDFQPSDTVLFLYSTPVINLGI